MANKFVESLMELVVAGDLEKIKRVFENKVDPNMKDWHGNTALMHAIHRDNISMMQLILQFNPDLNIQDFFGRTALMIIVQRRDVEFLKLLLQAKPNLDIMDKCGQTALIMASRNNNKEMVILLLNSGADMSIMDEDQNTAYDYANSDIKALLSAYMEIRTVTTENPTICTRDDKVISNDNENRNKWIDIYDRCQRDKTFYNAVSGFILKSGTINEAIDKVYEDEINAVINCFDSFIQEGSISDMKYTFEENMNNTHFKQAVNEYFNTGFVKKYEMIHNMRRLVNLVDNVLTNKPVIVETEIPNTSSNKETTSTVEKEIPNTSDKKETTTDLHYIEKVKSVIVKYWANELVIKPNRQPNNTITYSASIRNLDGQCVFRATGFTLTEAIVNLGKEMSD